MLLCVTSTLILDLQLISCLNRLMNCGEYRNHVYLSRYESTSDTHANIKMLAEKPDNLEYNVLVYEKA